MRIRLRLKALPVITIAGIIILTSCSPEEKDKILYINSYHDGYPSSDDISEGIHEILDEKNVELQIFYMDSKRNPGKEDLALKVKEALALIDDFSPDLVIASDDNAAGLIVSPYLNNGEIPVVFCGVNWSADQYGFGGNVTGMLEVYPLRECIQTIKEMNTEIRRMAILSENTQSEKNNTELLDTLYLNMGMEPEYHMVDDFNQWKEAFKELSSSSDLIYMPTNGAIRDWNREEAISFIEKNLKVPVITCDDFMMDYCVFGLTKEAKEQGEWSAETALRILGGTDPASIPYTRCSRWHAYLNQKLASIIDFKLKDEPSGSFTLIK